MSNKRNIFKLCNSIILFLFIYIIPLVINYYQTGATLTGNEYQSEIAYIENLNDLFNHLSKNFLSYLNISTNPIFWFFISAFLTQKTIKWVHSD